MYFQCFHILSYENPKFNAKIDLWEKKNDFTRKVSFEYFDGDRQYCTKKEGNHITLEEKNFTKNLPLSVFELVTYKKNAKMNETHSILGKKRTLRETCIMSVL